MNNSCFNFAEHQLPSTGLPPNGLARMSSCKHVSAAKHHHQWGIANWRKTMVQRTTIRIAIGVPTFAFAALLSINWSEQGGISVSADSAQARVGRPLTPVSAAGVARRQNRRAAYGGYGVGAGLAAGAAVATAGAVAAATAPGYYGGGTNNWGNAYAAQTDPYYGQPHYAIRAYYARSPYYGYTGWEDYSGRNFIRCQPGTMTKLDDGRMYPCQ
jgi:hypothetical protein